MATYKVKATYSVDVEIDIDATSEEEAISKLIQKDFKDVVEDGIIWRADSEDEQAELTAGVFKVKTTDICYHITEEDLYDEFVDKHPELKEDSEEFSDALFLEVEKLRRSLPTELEFEIDCEKEDLDDYVVEAVSDKTGWLTHYVNYEILEVK